MKLPDLSRYDDAGVLDYHGHADAVEAAVSHAKLRYLDVDLSHAEDKATLFAALAKGLALPEYFGSNFDALADVLEDRDWLGKRGCAIRLAHAAHYRRTHPTDWRTLEEVLSEASAFWRDRHLAFWVLVS
jgi:RNAse (barnase) inhibitor barstar